MIRSIASDELYQPNKTFPFGASITFHLLLLACNATILTGGSYHMAPELLQVQFTDKLPPLVQPVKPMPKPVEKHPAKKAKKAGLSLSRLHAPLSITRHPMPTHTQLTRKPF